MLAEVDPELARPSDRLRALGGGRWELKAAVDAECRHGLEKLQMLLSHTDPHLTLGELVARLVRDGLDRYDPTRPPRVRRTGARRSGVGERSASTPARRDTGSVERSVAGADGGGVERDAAGRRSTDAGNRGRCNATTARVLRRRSGKGEPAAMAGTWACTVSWSAQRARTDRGSTPTGAMHRGHQRPATAGPRLWRRSGWRTPPGRARWGRRSARRLCSGTLPRCAAWARRRAPGHGTSRRDQGCCSYVDRRSGRRCGSRYRLEIDHVVPFALGGGAEPANLRLRCEAHHRLRHAQRHDRPARMAD